MKVLLLRFTILTVLVLYWNLSYSQQPLSIDTASIQKEAKYVPRRFTKDPVVLANYLAQNYTDDDSKLIAFNYWIAKHIKYNTAALSTRDKGSLTTIQVLKGRKAICGEYSQLLTDMCAAEGIKSAVVDGYIKEFDHFDGDTLYRAEHAWSVVELNGEWQLMDVTWGSGYSTFRKQYFAKMMWRLFEIPYKLKGKYVHEYNADWFYVKPDEMVYSHLPILEMYQLLDNPVSQKIFEHGDSVLTEYLTASSKVNHTSKAIHNHIGLEKAQQYIIEANQGFNANPNNHRVNGFNYYKAVSEYFEKYYKEEHKLVSTNKANLDLMENYCSISDSMMRLSIEDNQIEYAAMDLRSSTWKYKVQSDNKALRDTINARIKMNKTQLRILEKTHGKNTQITRYAKKTKELKVSTLKGARKLEYSEEYKAQKLLIRADSLHQEAVKALQAKDSLLAVFTETDQIKITDIEDVNLAVNQYDKDLVEDELMYRLKIVPQIYLSESEINSDWFFQNLKLVDSLNMGYTDSILKGLNHNQILAREQMKVFRALMKQALRDIKLAKKLTLENHGEQALYQKYTQEVNSAFDTFEIQLSWYLYVPKDVKQLLKQEIRVLSKTKSFLSKQNWFENHRHRSYMHYRRDTQKDEDKLAKAVIKQVLKMNQAVMATKKYLIEFKEKELVSHR